MKNNSAIALALIFFLALAWYRMAVLPAETASSVNTLKAEAEKGASEGSPELAIKLYEEALKIKDTLEDRLQMFQYYKQCVEENSTEFGSRDLQSFLSETMDLYADQSAVYELAMNYWVEEDNPSQCASVMEEASVNEAVTDTLQAEYDTIKYRYSVNSSYYLDPLPYSEGVMMVKNGEDWVCLDGGLAAQFTYVYDQATICNEGLIAVQNGDVVKLLDADGTVQNAVRTDGTLAGAAGSSWLPVIVNGKYTYLNLTSDDTLSEYDYAGVFCNNRAAVQQGSQWQVINSAGETVLTSSEIVVDDAGRCAVGGRIFSKEGSDYGMYDTDGQLVATVQAEAVKCFYEESYAAACKDGKWGYIDTAGSWVIEPQYDDAESFSNGFAAVCTDGLWGYIDEDGVLAVECQFDGATAMTENGRALVQSEDYWRGLEFLCR